ncbi:protein takeout [Drosophila innubila]|uniref:protein takeout n=1 Tax=Drosophila innubila TaxID=198719 RepID=UPI00148D0643|nr:protein takeout [Drosophila innubila]
MSRFSYLIFLCLLALVHGNFPDDPKPCKYGDTKCIVSIINRLIIEKSETGDSDINIVKFEPFPVDKLSIRKGANSPININLELTNNYIYGLSTTRIKSVRGFGKDLTKKHELRMFSPILSMVGPYSINGKVLILPITGKGESNFTYANTETRMSFKGQIIERDGEIYMKLVDFVANSVPERVYFNFTNLFNGDKALGDNMNAFLNENWEPIYLEARPEIKAGLQKRFQDIIENVFSKIPYDKLFVE